MVKTKGTSKTSACFLFIPRMLTFVAIFTGGIGFPISQSRSAEILFMKTLTCKLVFPFISIIKQHNTQAFKYSLSAKNIDECILQNAHALCSFQFLQINLLSFPLRSMRAHLRVPTACSSSYTNRNAAILVYKERKRENLGFKLLENAILTVFTPAKYIYTIYIALADF
jgi:hypothetical protein